MLGETYEYVSDDFKFLAEKVSHHPPVMAAFASGKSYEVFLDNLTKPKFWGKSVELLPHGTSRYLAKDLPLVHVKLIHQKEHYTWTKFTSAIRGVLSSNRSIEHYGVLRIQNHSTGHYCELYSKESGYFYSTQNEVEGTVFSADGVPQCHLT
jgi:hypothetical protein